MTSVVYAQVQPFKQNFIHNGAFEFSQRYASSEVTLTSGSYHLDRWYGAEGFTTGAAKWQQVTVPSTVAPYIYGLKYALKNTAITGLTNPAAGEAAYFAAQKMEGYDFDLIKNKQTTMSFWVRLNHAVTADFPIKACASVKTPSGDRTLVVEYTITANNTWQEISFPIDFKTGATAGTWPTGSNAAALFFWYNGAGSTFVGGTTGVWNNANYSITSNCSKNLLSSTNDTVEITGVRLTEGTQKVEFQRAGGTYAGELALVQRYYEKSYSYTVPVGTATDIGTYMIRVGANSTNPIAAFVKFATSKRLADVTISIFDLLGNSNKVQAYDSSSDPANVGSPALLTTNDGFRIYSGITIPAHGFSFHWVASSEL